MNEISENAPIGKPTLDEANRYAQHLENTIDARRLRKEALKTQPIRVNVQVRKTPVPYRLGNGQRFVAQASPVPNVSSPPVTERKPQVRHVDAKDWIARMRAKQVDTRPERSALNVAPLEVAYVGEKKLKVLHHVSATEGNLAPHTNTIVYFPVQLPNDLPPRHVLEVPTEKKGIYMFFEPLEDKELEVAQTLLLRDSGGSLQTELNDRRLTPTFYKRTFNTTGDLQTVPGVMRIRISGQGFPLESPK